MEPKILKIADRKEERFLRKATKEFRFPADPAEVKKLIEIMKKAMRKANGVGLSANQIGIPHKVFVAEVPDQNGGNKFYAVFNPKIEKKSSGTVDFEEGCLSVPGMFGSVPRPEKITISGIDKGGKPLKIKAWGLLARVFQHEIDHLGGALFIDKAKTLYKIPESERLRTKSKLAND